MGSGGKSKQQQIPQITAPTFDTSPEGKQNLGYTQTPSPYTSQGQPYWMQGYFADPMWGRAAADPRVQLTHEMLGPSGAVAVNQAIYGNASPELMRQVLAQAQAQPTQGGMLAQGGGLPAGAVPPSMNPKSSIGMNVARGMGSALQSDMQRYPNGLPLAVTSGLTSSQGG